MGMYVCVYMVAKVTRTYVRVVPLVGSRRCVSWRFCGRYAYYRYFFYHPVKYFAIQSAKDSSSFLVQNNRLKCSNL